MASSETFAEFVRSRRPEIERALDAWLPGPPSCPAGIANAIRYAVGTRGKRMRPLLALASAEAAAQAAGSAAPPAEVVRRLALPAACAAEFIHTQSLVHDDLPAMDGDTMRRGQPTVHVRFGEGLAILAGDALLVEAFALLASAPDDHGDHEVRSRKLRTIATFAEAIGVRGMAGGQALDLAMTGTAGDGAGSVSTVAQLWDLHLRKTGSLFKAAATSGAIMAGASDGGVRAVASFAEQLGVAFQIADDILDVEGSLSSLGKTPGKDAQAGKQTFAAVAGIEHARTMAIGSVEDAIATLERDGLATSALRGLAWAAVARVTPNGGTAAGVDARWTATERSASADRA